MEGTLGAARPNDGRRPPTAVGRPPTRAECAPCVTEGRTKAELEKRTGTSFSGPPPAPARDLNLEGTIVPPTPPTLAAKVRGMVVGGGPSLRPRVQGGVARWTLRVPPWQGTLARYLGKVGRGILIWPLLKSVLAAMGQGLRDQGSRSKSGQTLESSDSGPGFRGSGTAGGEFRSRGYSPGVHVL